MAVTVHGKYVKFEVSEDDGATWKEIVCEEELSYNVSVDFATTQTKRCGTFKAPGIASFSASGSAVANADPTSTEVSAKDIADYVFGATKLAFRFFNVAYDTIQEGEVFYFSGDGYFGSTDGTSPAVDYVKFNWSFEADGEVDTTIGS